MVSLLAKAGTFLYVCYECVVLCVFTCCAVSLCCLNVCPNCISTLVFVIKKKKKKKKKKNLLSFQILKI